MISLALAALLFAPAAEPAAAPACDDRRAVEAVRAAAARERIDVSTLQLVVEGPYDRAKFLRTHPSFRPSAAVKQKLAKRKFWFVWFHPSFRGGMGAKGSDVWSLVDAARCELLSLSHGG
jgi:hypothetical protein